MGETDSVFSHYRIKYFREHCINHDKILLDAGCGAGKKIKIIDKIFYRLIIIGIDLSKVSLIYAHKNNKKAHLLMGDIENLPIRNESVDYITFFDVLEHLLNLNNTLRESHRVLKNGCYFHSFIPCEGQRSSIIGRNKMFQSLTMKYSGHIQHFTKQQIWNEIKKVRFTILDEKHSYFFFAQLIYFFSYIIPRRWKRSESVFINLLRTLIRILVSKIDLILSNRFPNHSIGYHITARK